MVLGGVGSAHGGRPRTAHTASPDRPRLDIRTAGARPDHDPCGGQTTPAEHGVGCGRQHRGARARPAGHGIGAGPAVPSPTHLPARPADRAVAHGWHEFRPGDAGTAGPARPHQGLCRAPYRVVPDHAGPTADAAAGCLDKRCNGIGPIRLVPARTGDARRPGRRWWPKPGSRRSPEARAIATAAGQRIAGVEFAEVDPFPGASAVPSMSPYMAERAPGQRRPSGRSPTRPATPASRSRS